MVAMYRVICRHYLEATPGKPSNFSLPTKDQGMTCNLLTEHCNHASTWCHMLYLQYHWLSWEEKYDQNHFPLPPIALHALQLCLVSNPGIVSQPACPVLGAIHITANPCDSETTLPSRDTRLWPFTDFFLSYSWILWWPHICEFAKHVNSFMKGNYPLQWIHGQIRDCHDKRWNLFSGWWQCAASSFW